MKLRFSNRHDFDVQFEANDLASFRENGMSALRSFRISSERRVHRGEIRKTVSWFDGGEIGVYDEHAKQWYNLEGDAKFIETESFGTVGIAQHFRLEVPVLETATLAEALADDRLNLICSDPLSFEQVYLLSDEGQLWNMCVNTYRHTADINTFLQNFSDDFEKLTEDPK